MKPLSPRMQEIAHLLARGLTYKGVAKELGISRHTVHRHVVAISERLPHTDKPFRWRVMTWYSEQYDRAA